MYMDSAVLTDRGLCFIAKVFNGCYALEMLMHQKGGIVHGIQYKTFVNENKHKLKLHRCPSQAKGLFALSLRSAYESINHHSDS